MKYIIESNDVIGYTPKYAMLFGDGYMIQPLEDLEELNSDYINEHFSDLQDEAYQRGVIDGRNESWEAARKIGHASQMQLKEMGFEFNSNEWFYNPSWYVVMNYTAAEAIEKIKAYEEKQKADDEINVGDVVEWDGTPLIVTRIFKPYNQKEQCDGIDEDGSVYAALLIENLTKTGRHFDIGDMLKGINWT